jgi:hypothetical protein
MKFLVVSDNEDSSHLREERKMRHLWAQRELSNFHDDGVVSSPSLERAVSLIQDWQVSDNVITNYSFLISNDDHIYDSPSRCYTSNRSVSSVTSGSSSSLTKENLDINNLTDKLVTGGSPIFVPPKLKRIFFSSASKLEQQIMSVFNTRSPVTPSLSPFLQVSPLSEDNVTSQQCAFSNVQDNFLGSFNFKLLLETPKCVPKKSFKIKILKDDLVDDDPEVQFTGRGVTKLKEYEGEPFKVRKFYKSNVNKSKRASETITVVPRTTVYSNGRKVTIKVPLRVPSVKSAITEVPFLSSTIKTLSTGSQKAFKKRKF